MKDRSRLIRARRASVLLIVLCLLLAILFFALTANEEENYRYHWDSDYRDCVMLIRMLAWLSLAGAVYGVLMCCVHTKSLQELPEEGSAAGRWDSAGATPGGGARLRPCPDCGRLLSRAATVCPQCGRPMAGELEPWTCPSCGKSNQPDVQFCPQCGWRH